VSFSNIQPANHTTVPLCTLLLSCQWVSWQLQEDRQQYPASRDLAINLLTFTAINLVWSHHPVLRQMQSKARKLVKLFLSEVSIQSKPDRKSLKVVVYSGQVDIVMQGVACG
jgi:hypothetical protein